MHHMHSANSARVLKTTSLPECLTGNYTRERGHFVVNSNLTDTSYLASIPRYGELVVQFSLSSAKGGVPVFNALVGVNP